MPNITTNHAITYTYFKSFLILIINFLYLIVPRLESANAVRKSPFLRQVTPLAKVSVFFMVFISLCHALVDLIDHSLNVAPPCCYKLI